LIYHALPVQIGRYHGHKELNSTKMQLQNRVLEQEQEKRKEYLECWRDLMFLKKYLFIALKDYWDLSPWGRMYSLPRC
jgi:hypothetical protein